MKTLPSIGQLQALESAARHLSFQKAADELHLTASAISHRVRDFESLSNTVVFHRDIRSIRLTPEGQAKLVEIKHILRNLERLCASTQAQQAFKIAMPSLYFSQLVLPQWQGFNSANPDINIDIEVSTNNKLNNRFDAVITYEKINKANWHSKKLFSATEVLVVKKALLEKHLEGKHIEGKHQEGKSLEDCLQKLPKIALAYSPKAWSAWEQSTKQSQVSKTITVSNMTEACAAAKSGLGVAILIEELIDKDLDEGSLALIARSKKRKKAFYLAAKTSVANDPNFQLFSQWLLSLNKT